jgi:UDP-glucose:(heptosyl)LPS alpha-1,3-glucosyltransferase
LRIYLLRRRYTGAGGAELFTQRLAAILHQRGHEVRIVAEEWPESPNGVYQVEKISSNDPKAFAGRCLDRLGNPKDAIILSLERTLRQHIYRAGDGVHSRWLERRKKHQTRLQQWWGRWDPKHQSLVELEKKVFTQENTDWILANSNMVRREILEGFSFPEQRIRVIHPGVDLKIFQPCRTNARKNDIRKSLGVPADVVVWSFVGSGFERKGLAWAMEIAAAQKESVWLLVLGKGKQRAYERLSSHLGIGKRFIFLPEGSRALDVYHASDAFILPTIYDPCSNACLEAAACGLPVITTSSNGASEIVRGAILEDPSKTEECAELCRPFAQPLRDPYMVEIIRAHLDDRPCWDALLKLCEDAARSVGIEWNVRSVEKATEDPKAMQSLLDSTNAPEEPKKVEEPPTIL